MLVINSAANPFSLSFAFIKSANGNKRVNFRVGFNRDFLGV